VTSIILLFAIMTAPDGTKSIKDIAMFGDEDVCALTANVLNESPRKSPDIRFACRIGKPEVKS
jgi:hypothetical protein